MHRKRVATQPSVLDSLSEEDDEILHDDSVSRHDEVQEEVVAGAAEVDRLQHYKRKKKKKTKHMKKVQLPDDGATVDEDEGPVLTKKGRQRAHRPTSKRQRRSMGTTSASAAAQSSTQEYHRTINTECHDYMQTYVTSNQGCESLEVKYELLKKVRPVRQGAEGRLRLVNPTIEDNEALRRTYELDRQAQRDFELLQARKRRQAAVEATQVAVGTPPPKRRIWIPPKRSLEEWLQQLQIGSNKDEILLKYPWPEDVARQQAREGIEETES